MRFEAADSSITLLVKEMLDAQASEVLCCLTSPATLNDCSECQDSYCTCARRKQLLEQAHQVLNKLAELLPERRVEAHKVPIDLLWLL